MDAAGFRASLDADAPPSGLRPAQQALWWFGRRDWDRAHELAQSQDDAEGAWVHALLHRQEGDLGNARYWYRRAGRPEARGSLDDEWEAMVEALSSGG